MRASLFALTYKMMKIKTINHHIHEVDLVETNDGPSKKLSYYANYAEVCWFSHSKWFDSRRHVTSTLKRLAPFGWTMC